MSSGTDPRRRAAAPPLALLAALPALLAALPALLAPPPASAATSADLRKTFERADRSLAQAERAVDGKDPGKVSLHLQRVDEQLQALQVESGIEVLVKAFQEARAAAGASDLEAAAAAVRRAGGLMPAVNDYLVLREAAEASRAAIRAAEAREGAEFLQALDRFDASILAPVLAARLRQARDAVALARKAMVRADMADGRARIGEARRALNGFACAGALARATYALAIGGELLEGNSVIAARDQLQKAMRDLRQAAESGPDKTRAALEEARARTFEIWKRSGRGVEEDAGRLADLARQVDAIRLKQSR